MIDRISLHVSEKLYLFWGGEGKGKIEPEPLLQRGIFLRMYSIGHLFEFISSGRRFELEKQCTKRSAELLKVENCISPDILRPCHIDQVNGTKFLGFHS